MQEILPGKFWYILCTYLPKNPKKANKVMNKIIIQSGMLIFFISIIFFSQRGMAVQDILVRSLIIFVSFSILLSIIMLVFLKAINKTAVSKRKNSITENLGKEQ